jgi:membrane associated rhomboid family serine protease
VLCGRCGALNGGDFGRCIRCGIELAALAERVQRARGGLDGRNLLATKILGVLTVFVLTGQMWAAHAQGLGPLSKWTRANCLRFGALQLEPGRAFEPFRLLSAIFVHMDVVHFGMNMLALSFLARAAEPAVGSARFAIAYVITGIAGYVASAAWSLFVQPETVCTAGASGAVFGVMGLLLGWLLRRRDPRWKDLAVQAAISVVLFGFAVNALSDDLRINNAAHLGGLVTGVAFGLSYAGPPLRRLEGALKLGALASVLACVAALVLAQRSPLWRTAETRVRISQTEGGSHEIHEMRARRSAATGATSDGLPAPDRGARDS